MEIVFTKNKAAIKELDAFDPQQIFDNGQAFRFLPEPDGAYAGVAHGRFLRVSREPTGDVVLQPCTPQEFEEIWFDYFDLGRDYSALFADCTDPALREGRQYAPGLRVLRQEPFETLISFIISANNNIKRIRGIIAALCARFGTPFACEGTTHHAFPTPHALAAASEAELRDCGCGYRAPYLLKTAGMAASGFDLQALYALPYPEAKKELVKLPGVGQKVADCVLLFAYAKTDAFPADVWIKRVLQTLYGFSGNAEQTCAFVLQKFGECAGIAQQYLFYYARENRLL